MKLKYIFIFLLAVLAGVLFLLRSPGADTSVSAQNHRITCILPSHPNSAFWPDIEASAYKAADDLDADITMLYSGSEGNLAMPKNDAIEIAILSGTEAIVTSYSNANEDMIALLKKAREAGIYVVLIDSDGGSGVRDIFVSIDNGAAGYALGEAALNELGDGKLALLVSSGREHPNMVEREAGIANAFNLKPEAFNVINADTQNSLQLSLAIEKYLSGYDNVGAIITTTERSTIICSQLIRRLGLTDSVKLYGFDQSDETMALLNSGDLRALIFQHHSEIGYEGVKSAVDLINGVPFDSDFRTVEYELLYSGEEAVRNEVRG